MSVRNRLAVTFLAAEVLVAAALLAASGSKTAGADTVIRADETPAKDPGTVAIDSGNPAVPPLTSVGLLVYTDPQNNKNSFSCSAQFIAPRVILTAAHCVRADPGEDPADNMKQMFYDAKNFSFLAQYQNGQASHIYKIICSEAFGQFTLPANYPSMTKEQQTVAVITTRQWDYAMMLVDSNSITGQLQVQTDWKGNWKAATRVGYPEPILGTRIVQRAHGILFFADTIPLFGTSYPNLVAHFQDNPKFTSGSSGGAWIANFSDTVKDGNNVVLSVNSFHVSDYPGVEFGPYLQGTDFNAMLAQTNNGCK